MKNFFDTKDAQVWTITLECIQEADDNADSDNEFKVYIYRTPGGGHYYRFDGKVAMDDDNIKSMQAQVQSITEILGWPQ